MGKWQIASILELANSIAKQRAMWNSRPQVEHIWGIFDLVVFTVNFIHSMRLPESMFLTILLLLHMFLSNFYSSSMCQPTRKCLLEF